MPPEEGIGYFTYNLSRKLIEKGHQVTIITRGSLNKTQRETLDDIKVIKAPFIPLYPFYLHIHGMFVKRIIKSLESEIDILHFHTPLPPFIKTPFPTITTVHTPMLVDNRYIKISSLYSLLSKISAKLVSYPLELKIIQHSDIVTTVSKSVAQELREYHLNPERVAVVGNGVDEKLFCPKQKISEDTKKYVMFAGRIDREKGLFDLVESARYICSERSDVFFVIAGKGRDLDKLKQMVKKKGILNRFIFVGQVDRDQLVKLYQNATIFVFPSYHEGLPGAVLEAMSCGLPVVATDVRGNSDIIINEKNGILVPPRSPRKLADAIYKLLEHEDLRKNLGSNARKIVEKRYSWNVVSNRFIRCYESLIEGNYENMEFNPLMEETG
ncbi:MAG TPA: glycosyltransferase family 1 protein [Thermoplasmatales archaeon]|nr:glycosyltransferase family 1 protein [Thermoplasmatales archaeon]